MKALFLGTLTASQATPIIEFITADIRTEILDTNEPAQAAVALADANRHPSATLEAANTADFAGLAMPAQPSRQDCR